MLNKVEDYIQRLGEREFKTREIEIAQWSDPHRRYDHWFINAALEKIPWVRQINRGRGEWRLWRVNRRHAQFPGSKKEKRNFDPMSLPDPSRKYVLPMGEAFAPGHYREYRRRLAWCKRVERR